MRNKHELMISGHLVWWSKKPIPNSE